MCLQDIAAIAIAEDANPDGQTEFDLTSDEQAVGLPMTGDSDHPQDPISVTENPDGTFTYTLEISFDPEVQKKMAKAMPKGVKRDDLADDLGDDDDDAEETADDGSAEPAEDSAPRGVFAAALDEIVAPSPAADAAPSRHSKTPLENCRAKDPMYCPYHGDKAIKKAIEDNLAKQGVSAYTVNVTPQGSGMFGISVTTPTPSPSVTQSIINAFNDSQGLMKSGITLHSPTSSNSSVQIDKSADPDRDTAMLDEWMDDLMLDIAGDPSLMQELDPQDMRDLLAARDLVSQTPASLGGQPNPVYEKFLKDARDKYHTLRAQADYRHIKSPLDAKTTEDSINQDMTRLSGDYHAEKSPVDAAKKALFANGKFPNGFAKAHQWVSDYNKSSTRVGYFCQKDYDDARSADLNLAPVDVKGRRTAISAMDFAREQYSDALDDYKKEVPKFMKEFENWAQGELAAGRISQQQFDTAFPKNAPTNAAVAQQPPQGSSGKVTLPQSWNNFVMGDNLVMPTDGLPDIPYGKEKGFHDAFDSAFPKLPVPDVMESFEIKPASGEVIYSLSPGATALNANAPKHFVNALWGAGYVGTKLQPIPQKQGFEVVIPFNANLAGK